MTFSAIIGAWVAAGLTLFILSFLYRDNPLFKVAENLYVGVSAGYWFTVYAYDVWVPKVWLPLSAGLLWPILPALLGITMLFRLHPKYAWVSRMSFAYMIGYGAGMSIPVTMTSQFMKQVSSTIQPLVAMSGASVDFSGAALFSIFSALVLMIGLLCTLLYFFFSAEHTGVLKVTSKMAVYFLMIYFGAAYGITVMGRFALLYGRFAELYTYSSGIYFYATPILLLFVIGFMIKFKGKKHDEPPLTEQV
jgi:hypothetical protein